MVHISTGIEVLKNFKFEEDRGATRIVKEPIGVCGMITPWNWPINQIACKVVPALATGCTMVLKPSEEAPFSAYIWAEVMHAAGVPAGVFNMVNGTGPEVGAAIAGHPGIDMVSFTGSTRAGVEVAKAAAPTRQARRPGAGRQEPQHHPRGRRLAERPSAAASRSVMNNSGQSCNAPTRMLVPAKKMDEAIAIAKAAAEPTTVGDPNGNAKIGPVVNKTQWEKIQRLIKAGIAEGATLVTGGPDRPEGLDKGYYVKPTVFANVTNDMTIAKEEIFGPVVSILGYKSVDEAVKIGNDTEYGLAAYISGTDMNKVRDVAAQAARRPGVDQRRRRRHDRAVRRLQDERQRARVGRLRLPRVPRNQGRARLHAEAGGGVAPHPSLPPCGEGPGMGVSARCVPLARRQLPSRMHPHP